MPVTHRQTLPIGIQSFEQLRKGHYYYVDKTPLIHHIAETGGYYFLCGYTDHDIDTVFAPELPGLDRDDIRRWYNGYRWGGQDVPSVYNPFDVLLLFEEREFGPYWFESATPTFLVNLLKERGVFTPQLSTLQAKA